MEQPDDRAVFMLLLGCYLIFEEWETAAAMMEKELNREEEKEERKMMMKVTNDDENEKEKEDDVADIPPGFGPLSLSHISA